MRTVTCLTAVVAALLGGAANAGVDAVITASNASVTLTNKGGVASGAQLKGDLNDDFSAGSSFDATSDVDGPEITFKNGNFAAGGYSTVSSFTSLDVTFTNDSNSVVVPRISSTILPAGLGLFVGSGCGTGLVRDCAEDVGAAAGLLDLPINFQLDSSLIARSTFDFVIRSGESIVYSLSGSLSLFFGGEGGNFLSADLENAAATLTNFTQAADRSTAQAYSWDATDIQFDLPGEMAIGESRTLTYETGVTTYTASPLLRCAGAVAFSAFGDPIGRNGSIPPPTDQFRQQARSPDGDGGCTPSVRAEPYIARTFKFATPTFENGQFTLALLPPFGGSVPEPASWAMMLAGFGIAGSALRRRRAFATA